MHIPLEINGILLPYLARVIQHQQVLIQVEILGDRDA